MKFKRRSHLREHQMKHCGKGGRSLKRLEQCQPRQRRNRIKDIHNNFLKCIEEFTEEEQKREFVKLLKTNTKFMDRCGNKFKNKFNEKDIIELVRDINLSDRQCIKILAKMREKWGRDVITSNIRDVLVDTKRSLKHLFTCTLLHKDGPIHFKSPQGTPLTRYLVYCNDLQTLTYMKDVTEEEEDAFERVIGEDDGKDILKVSYNAIKKGELSPARSKNIVDRGVKFCQVIAAVRDVKESYHNLSIINSMLKVNSINCSISMDLKCIAMSLGMTTAASRHPCPYGLCHKAGAGQGPLWTQGDWVKEEDRSLESLQQHQEQWWREARANRKLLKDYYNVEFQPLFSTYRPSWSGPLLPTYILEKIPPPPLHTFRLGPVNHLLDSLNKYFPELGENLASLHVVKEGYHGDMFEGNECWKILRHLDALKIPDHLQDYQEALDALLEVNNLVSNPILPPNYASVIKSWKEAWSKLRENRDITVTNKIHILNDHLEVRTVLY